QHDEATVYVTMTGYRFDEFDAYVYVSRDYGATWTSLVNNLPAEPINVIGEDPANSNILYIGTDTGVFASVDRGLTWQALCDGLPTIPIYDLVVHPRDGELVIGTHGRSVFVADISAVRRQASQGAPVR
nr:glycosyl hydrolase [Acidobacteriota bacterium]